MMTDAWKLVAGGVVAMALVLGGGAALAQGEGGGGGGGGGGGPVDENAPPKNLKVLPKEMARKDVTALMKQFNKALGVKCAFCHDTKDYASDENEHKKMARSFMQMTLDMQKQYFAYPKAPKVEYNCYVCHQGNKEPRLAP